MSRGRVGLSRGRAGTDRGCAGKARGCVGAAGGRVLAVGRACMLGMWVRSPCGHFTSSPICRSTCPADSRRARSGRVAHLPHLSFAVRSGRACVRTGQAGVAVVLVIQRERVLARPSSSPIWA